MKRITKKIITIFISALLCICCLTACGEPKASPAIAIGYKTDGFSAGAYDESISKFVVGEDMYCCVTVKIITDQKKPYTYNVEVRIPKTEKIEIDNRGGIAARETIEDPVNQITILKFDVNGSREETQHKIMFKGFPCDEGSAKIEVQIYDQEGKALSNGGYFSTVDFVRGE